MLPVHREVQEGTAWLPCPSCSQGDQEAAPSPHELQDMQRNQTARGKTTRFLEVLDEAPQEADRKGRRREVDSQGSETKLGPRLPASPDVLLHPRRYLFLSEQEMSRQLLGASLPVMFSTPATWGCHKHSLQLRATKPTLCVPRKQTVTCTSSSGKNQNHQTGPCEIARRKEIGRPGQERLLRWKSWFPQPSPRPLPRGMCIDDCMTRSHSQAPGGRTPGRGSTHSGLLPFC